jgi:transcription antitermination protein NusB
MTPHMEANLSPRARLDRSRSRAWALQVLYRWESEGAERSLLDVLLAVGRTRRIAPSRIAFAERILSLVEAHGVEIDQSLTEVTKNWRLERLSRIDRSILRIGGAELLYIDDVPPKVAIQEAVRLAERYGGNESPRFVNGVLDALYHGMAGEGE